MNVGLGKPCVFAKHRILNAQKWGVRNTTQQSEGSMQCAQVPVFCLGLPVPF